MPFLNNFFVRLIVAGVLTYIGLEIHMRAGPTSGIGIAAIYVIFVAYAWAGAAFHPKLIGSALLLALPNIFIPPAVLFPMRAMGFEEDLVLISVVIGVFMSIYSAFMIGWMMDLLRKKTGENVPIQTG